MNGLRHMFYGIWPDTLRYLALDWGKSRIGFALGDGEAGIAFPVGVLRNHPRIMSEIAALCKKESVDAIVMGLPKTLRGELGPQGKEIEDTAMRLRERLAIPLFFEDERLTTKLASKMFGSARRTHIDAVAAALILQGFLDRTKNIKQLHDGLG